MRKFFLSFILILVTACFLYGEADTQLKVNIAETMEEISRSYLEAYPDPVTKQGIAILEIENISDKAKAARIGELIRAYFEEAMDRSLIFVLTDREHTETIINEMKFSASGMVSDDSAVELGEITGTAILLSGSVAEEGADFRIQIKLTAIQTGEVLTVRSFSLPQSDLVEASTDLEYGYVAANGLGFGVEPLYFITADPMFNRNHLIMTDINAKYRISRELMISGGIMFKIDSTDSEFRWDPGQYPSQSPVSYGDLQPDLPSAYQNFDVGQITASVTDATAFHLDLQYTINFAPFFNIGITAGVVNFLQPKTSMRYSSNSGLYYDDTGTETGGTAGTETLKIDNMELEYIFESTFGGKIEISPEFFFTHRFAVSGTIGYLLTLPAVLRSVNASEGQWAYYDMAVESNFSAGAVEKYYGFDPVLMPDGTNWLLDFSGLYASICISVFF